MPHARDAFVSGTLPESALRLLADTWHADFADVFARDEQLLIRWVTKLPHRDARTVLSPRPRLPLDRLHHPLSAV